MENYIKLLKLKQLMDEQQQQEDQLYLNYN